MSYYHGPNRYLCTVLEEMRKQLESLDKYNMERYISITKLMIEEAQTHANHMEAGLDDWRDLRAMRDEKKKLKKEIKDLEVKKKRFKDEGAK